MDISGLMLPVALLEHFEVIRVNELCDISKKEVFIDLHLKEKNILPEGYNQDEYESKGFYPSKRVQDFPIRGKAFYLCIARRVWRKKATPNITIKSDYSFISEGSKLTADIANFLKGIGREPSRYDK